MTVEATRVAEAMLLAAAGAEVLPGASRAGARLAGDTTAGWPWGNAAVVLMM